MILQASREHATTKAAATADVTVCDCYQSRGIEKELYEEEEEEEDEMTQVSHLTETK